MLRLLHCFYLQHYIICQIHIQLQLHAWFQGDVCNSPTEKTSRYVQVPARNELKKY